MVADQPWQLSPGLNFLVYVPKSKSVVHVLLLDFGWLVTILWMVDDEPGDAD